MKPVAGLAISLFLFVLALAGLSSAWSSFSRQPLPQFNDCFTGRNRLPDLRAFDGQNFWITDEAHYLSAAAKWRHGAVATDSIHEQYEAAAAFPEEQLASLHPAIRSPVENIQALSRLRVPNGIPDFVSYRTVYFSLIGVPSVASLGCTPAALEQLRNITFAFRLLLPLVLALLIFKLASSSDPVGRFVLAGTGMALAAWDAQLSEAASRFSPDVPAAVLLLSGIWLYAHSLQRADRLRYAALSGMLFAAVMLIKFDFIYALPAALLVVVWLGWRWIERPGQGRLSGSSRMISLRSRPVSLMVIVICLIVLAGSIWRNASLTGQSFITSKDSVNLWIGNSPTAKIRDYAYGLAPDEEIAEKKMTADEIDLLRQHGFESAQRRYYRRQFLQRLYTDPLAVAAGLADKAWLVAHNGTINLFPVLGAAGYWLGWLVNLVAWAGMALLLLRKPDPMQQLPESHDPAQWLVAGLYFFSFLIVVAAFFLPRFLSHLFPLAIVLAVLTVGRLPGLLQK